MTIEARIAEIRDLVEANGKAIKSLEEVLMSQTLTAKEASEFLGYSYRHFIGEIYKEIPHERIGKTYHFKLRDLEEWKDKYTA